MNEKILKFDGLYEAEKLTGKSYKKDDDTMMTGFAMTHINNQIKMEMLKNENDSYRGIETESYVGIIENYGFELMLKDRKTNREDYQYVYYHKEHGFLLVFDSFGGELNGGKCFYQYLYKHGDNLHVSSGGPENDKKGLLIFNKNMKVVKDPDFPKNIKYNLYIGDHYCIEALIHNLNKVKNGKIMCKHWYSFNNTVKIYLNDNHEDCIPWHAKDSVASRRMNMLPDWLKDKLCYENS